MTNLEALYFLPVLVLASFASQTIDESLSSHTVLTGPEMAYLGSKVAFQCKSLDSSTPITYQLLKDRHQLVPTSTALQGDQMATFYVKVVMGTEGSYHCKTTTKQGTAVSNSIRLMVVIPASGTRVTSEPSPPILFEGSRLLLNCDVTRGSHLSYTWFYNRQELTSSTPLWLQPAGNKLLVERVTPKHAGNYSCMAKTLTMVGGNRRFSSSEVVQVIVKVYFSTPRIAFSISKEGFDYHGNVTCWSSKGSPPVTFQFLLDNREEGLKVEATGPLVASFPVAMVPGRDFGTAQCRVESEVQQSMSETLTLEVAPVSGHVKVEVEHLYRADYEMSAIMLRCHLSRGTFPSFSWLLNDSLLRVETHDTHPRLHPSSAPHYTFHDHGRTLILLQLGPEDSGYYSCRARDSYDNSSPWVESEPVLINMTVGTQASPSCILSHTVGAMTPIEVFAIAFCCFLLLALAVAVACVMRMFDDKNANGALNAATNSEASPLSDVASRSVGKHADPSSVDTTVHNQTIEITV